MSDMFLRYYDDEQTLKWQWRIPHQWQDQGREQSAYVIGFSTKAAAEEWGAAHVETEAEAA